MVCTYLYIHTNIKIYACKSISPLPPPRSYSSLIHTMFVKHFMLYYYFNHFTHATTPHNVFSQSIQKNLFITTMNA
jgi:hypothetical protein